MVGDNGNERSQCVGYAVVATGGDTSSPTRSQ